ncbi:MAG: hypothetical protein JWO82_1516 [Akkermansiaceae bacterium]|nr:hypothetical protein [Akkermansiaceae bacterium]
MRRFLIPTGLLLVGLVSPLLAQQGGPIAESVDGRFAISTRLLVMQVLSVGLVVALLAGVVIFVVRRSKRRVALRSGQRVL